MIPIRKPEQLQKIILESENNAVAIFKHSTRCSVSRMALNLIEQDWERYNPTVPIYYLDLLNYREISNQIAETFGVRHQSPQLLVIHKGRCIYHASHEAIDALAVSGLMHQR